MQIFSKVSVGRRPVWQRSQVLACVAVQGATLVIDAAFSVADVDERVYGSFVERYQISEPPGAS